MAITHQISDGPAHAVAHLYLTEGQTVRAEQGALVAMSPNVELHADTSEGVVQMIQEQLLRLGCMQGERSGAFEPPTVQGLRRASLLSDERYLWHRPTMAALRALKKIATPDGCGRQQLVASPRCLRINGEDYCP